MPRPLRRAVALAAAVAASALVLAGCAPDGGGRPPATSSATAHARRSATPRPTPTPTPTPTFDKSQLSIDDPTSIWVVVNKLRPLNPRDYVPPDLVQVPVQHVYTPLLRKEASDAVVAMFAAAQSEAGLGLQSQSAYRSYSTQVSTYNGYVASRGQAGADLTSARPGYSEHQTGLALDISSVPAACTLAACFGQTPQGMWLAANAYRFGFILRYPADKTAITGYEYEPWHFRYVGVALATEMHDEGVETLEEFFGLPPAPDYAPGG